jgi:hypothetical protein
MALVFKERHNIDGVSVTIYALLDGRDGSPFYVGATKRHPRHRLDSHIHAARTLGELSEKSWRIRSMLAVECRPRVVALEEVPYGSWPEAEVFWIGYLKFIGADLVNLAEGGPGASGCKQTEDTRVRRQLAAAGRDMSPMHLPEAREKAARKLRTPITYDGVDYPGIKAASRVLGVPYSTFHYRYQQQRRETQ